MTEVVRSGGIAPARATAIVAVVGLVITLTVSWTAWTLNRHNEHRLLEVQTRQAAAVLSSTILSLRNPLETALQIEEATGGSTDQFDQFASTFVGPHSPFVSAVLLRSDGSTWRPVATVGVEPLLSPASPEAQDLIRKSLTSTTFVVTPVPVTGPRRIGYVVSDPATSTAIYAERAIPANRRVPAESTSAFADLDFATYLGPTTDLSALATTDLPLAQLPHLRRRRPRLDSLRRLQRHPGRHAPRRPGWHAGRRAPLGVPDRRPTGHGRSRRRHLPAGRAPAERRAGRRDDRHALPAAGRPLRRAALDRRGAAAGAPAAAQSARPQPRGRHHVPGGDPRPGDRGRLVQPHRDRRGPLRLRRR